MRPGTAVPVVYHATAVAGANAQTVPPVGSDTSPALLSHQSCQPSAASRLSADEQYQKAGADYMNLPKDNPAYERIDSWLMLAFAGMPGGNLKEFGDIMTNCSYPSSRSRMSAASSAVS